jgi:FAD:protein FMN transferase
MGMPITVDIPSCGEEDVFEAVFRVFHRIDARFSTYKPDSEVSRFIRKQLSEAELSPQLEKIIKECRRAAKQTDGYFSAWAAGAFDPSGYVKGWAIAEAGKTIETLGFKTYCISAGGDILARSDSDKVWNIGIQDPTNPKKIIKKLGISNGAVATSGNYERGSHIINPKTGKPADDLLSVTITGPDILKADILATACFAMGPKAAAFMKTEPDYQLYLLAAVTGEIISDDFRSTDTQFQK